MLHSVAKKLKFKKKEEREDGAPQLHELPTQWKERTVKIYSCCSIDMGQCCGLTKSADFAQGTGESFRDDSG